jgi:aldehyde dehydrogenase (NAD+)
MSSLLPAGVNIRHLDRLYIGGEWTLPTGGGSIEIVSPNTEQVVAQCAEASQDDMDRAVAAARRAFHEGPWPKTPPAQRAAMVRQLAERLAARVGELGACGTAQVGILARIAPAMAQSGLLPLTRYAAWAEEYKWVERRDTVMPGQVGYVVQEPVGVVACIAPWNSPFSLMTQKIAPALVAGCAIIMKPSPETPLEAYIIAEEVEAVGFPPGVVNLVPSQREAADHLIRNPGVDKVSFTGSSAVGKRIATVMGERIGRYTLELGGKSAAIIHDDFPTEAAAKILGRTITILSGQVCAMLTRVIVPAKRHDELAEAIAAEMRSVKVGYSEDMTSEMGPVAMKRQLDRVERYVAQGQVEGAHLVTGGARPSHLNHGYFIEPTLFADVKNSSTVAQEEIFGPVLCLIKAEDEDHAVAIANDTVFGLNSAVFSSNPQNAYRIGRRLRSGLVGQNGLQSDFTLPFGGFKQSGVGREGGPEGIQPYVETKSMLLAGEVDISS